MLLPNRRSGSGRGAKFQLEYVRSEIGRTFHLAAAREVTTAVDSLDC